MDQDFSNYLRDQQFLAVSQVQSNYPSIMTASNVGHQNNEIDSDFYDLYNYTTNVLKTWGLNIGVLTASRQNMKTVNCLMQLIRIRQKDLQYKQKVRDDLSKAEYDKQTIKSKLGIATNQVSQIKKKLGQLQNKYKQEQIKFRKQLKSIGSQKHQLMQSKQKLQQKNTQLLHQVKKKQLQANKIRDSIKKPSQKTQPKNSFQIVSSVAYVQTEDSSKYTILKDKYQNERKYYLKQNSILKQQLEDAEGIINQFIVFLKQNCQSKALQQLNLNPNHPIDYNEGRLLERLSQTLQDIKSTLVTIIQQPSKARPTVPLQTKFSKRSTTEIPPPKMTQSVAIKPSRKQVQDDYFKKVMKDDISIISHIDMKDVQMPMKGKLDYDKWDILYDGRL